MQALHVQRLEKSEASAQQRVLAAERSANALQATNADEC
jgi:hypothetical protein